MKKCLATYKPLLTICLRAGSVNTLPLVVLITPGFNLVSSTKYGYTTPSNDISTNWVGLKHFQIANGPTNWHVNFLLLVVRVLLLGQKRYTS